MKILYLVPHVPNPTKTRSYFQTRGLAEAGHVVTIATLARSPKDVENIRKLEAEGFQVISAPLGKAQSAVNSLKKLLSRQPLQAAFMRSDILQRKLEEHLSKNSPDVIHVEHLRMTTYG